MVDDSTCSLEAIADLPLHVTVIHNPICGWRSKRKLQRFVATAMLRGLTMIVRTTRHAGEAEVMAAEAAADGWTQVVVVAGGDGTINEVINGLAGVASPPLVALLPLGTANVLAAEIAVADSATTLVDSIVRAANRWRWHPDLWPGRTDVVLRSWLASALMHMLWRPSAGA
ncbi:MAG: acylglycerol kinase family protein [Rhodospirillales bacterium]|nr:acylglycerol kinase family protein [Rhodospirillales bacterium]